MVYFKERKNYFALFAVNKILVVKIRFVDER